MIDRAILGEKEELESLEGLIEGNYRYQVELFKEIYEGLQNYHPHVFPLEKHEVERYLRDSRAIVIPKKATDEEEEGDI